MLLSQEASCLRTRLRDGCVYLRSMHFSSFVPQEIPKVRSALLPLSMTLALPTVARIFQPGYIVLRHLKTSKLYSSWTVGLPCRFAAPRSTDNIPICLSAAIEALRPAR